MAIMTIGINPAVFMESFQSDPSPKWVGKVINADSNEGYSADQANFELSEGVVTMRLAAGVGAYTKGIVSEFHVGHALSQVLQVGDRLELRHGGDGSWTYWVVRNDLLLIGDGCLVGKYGSNVEIHWHKKDHEIQKDDSQSQADRIREVIEFNGYSRAIVQLANHKFELREQEEIVVGPYYVRCLHLGSGGMPGRSPRVAVLITSRPEIREAFAGYFSFEDHLSKRFREIYSELFESFNDPQKRNQWPPEEYEKEHKRRRRELELRVSELYVAFGLQPPKSRWA